MTTIAVWLKVEQERIVHDLEKASERLDSADGEMALDFSSVQQITASALAAISELAAAADDRGVKVVLGGVNVEIYKVLKLVKLASRFPFVS